MQGPEVFVNGHPVTSLGYWGDLKVVHRWPLGSWELSWSMALAPFQRPTPLVAGAEVFCTVGPHRIWAGNLTEPDWNGSTFIATGAARRGETTIAFDGTGLTTSIPDVAIDRAITRGIGWTRPTSISAVAFSSDTQTDALNYVAALLDAYASSAQVGWYVDEYRAVRVAPAPSAPSALLMPDNGQLGVATETQVATLFGRYDDTTTGQRGTVTVGSGLPERGVSWGNLGPMTSARALELTQGVWAPLQGQTGWTNPITVQDGELVSPGDVPIPLWSFRAGPAGMLRLLGLRDPRGLSASTDIVIAESTWAPGDGTLQLNPAGMAARDTASIVEQAGGVLL